jgi:cell division protein FtsQ
MTKILRQKTKDFFRTNQLLRKIRNFFHQSVAPILIKAVVILITLLVLIFAMLKIFKPAVLEKVYEKSSFYFFHCLNLDNREFGQINVSGNYRVTKEEIISIVSESEKRKNVTEYSLLIQGLIDEVKTRLPWINQVVMTRSMPDILNISIVEYEPFAIWQNDEKKFIIDKDGNAVPFEDKFRDEEEFKNMVILSGKYANTHAKSLFNIFVIDPNLSENVYSATWVGNRRWDIRFDSGLLIKLPEHNISDAWQRLIKIYNMPGSIVGLKIIDLRIADKVYLEYEDSVIREMKSL